MSAGLEAQIRELAKDYNVAVANGMISRAFQLQKRLRFLERERDQQHVAENETVLDVHLASELLQIHRRGRTYQGLTPAGWLRVMTGGAIGPDEKDMPLDVAMKHHDSCLTCHEPYPCATLKLFVDAGALSAELLEESHERNQHPSATEICG